MASACIKQLFIYPVKSLAGVAVDTVEVTGKGLAGDREWMIVNRDGRFVTQRQLPQMARIEVTLTETGLRLSNARAGAIDVHTPAPDAPTQQVIVWSHNCQAQATGEEVSQWLAEALQYRAPLQLVKFAPAFTRATVAERFGDATTHFADAAPFLVANWHSLEALNRYLVEQGLTPVDMRHFRPNIVANGLPAFAEHRMTRLSLTKSALSWELCDHCQRCSIITVNPDTGKRHPQTVPFPQLAAINPMPGNSRAPVFGVNARLLADQGGYISTGMNVQWSNDVG